MAKKQTIILTHGTNTPSADVVKSLKLGEVLVQHAAEAKDAALHTTLKEGEEAVLVSFPSKEWVNAEIANLKISDVNGQISALQDALDKIEADYKQADEDLTTDYRAADAVIVTAFGEADAELKSNLEGKITKVENDYKAADQAINESLNAAADRIKALEDDYAALNDTYATDDELASAKSELEGKIAKAKTTLELATGVTAGVKVTQTQADPNIYKVEAVGLAKSSELTALSDIVDVIKGDDAGMSMKEVAEREVKVLEDMLYGSGSTAAIDTLKDVIDWIGTDESGATKIVSDIAELQKVTSGYTGANAIQKDIQSVKDNVANLGNIYATDEELAGVKSELEGEIAKAKTTLTEAPDVTEGVKVVKDSEDPNKYTVTAVGLAKSSELTALSDKVDIINGAGEGSFSKAIADAVGAEQTARENADKEINDKLGTGVTSGNTATAQFAAINAKLGAGVTSGNTATAQINGLGNRIKTIEDSYINTVSVTNTDTNKITASVASNTLTLNFDSMVIDGGEY